MWRRWISMHKAFRPVSGVEPPKNARFVAVVDGMVTAVVGVAARSFAGNDVQPVCNRCGRNGPNDTRRISRCVICLIYRACMDPMNPLNRSTSQDWNTRNEQVSDSSPLVGSLFFFGFAGGIRTRGEVDEGGHDATDSESHVPIKARAAHPRLAPLP